MLDIHRQAIAAGSASYHVFLQKYKRDAKVIYCVVEGFEDSCFYRPYLESVLPLDWDVTWINAGNKNNVYRTHKRIDFRRFPKKQINFFVDQDLATIIPEERLAASNIYVTRKYSIENELASKASVVRLLVELGGFGTADETDLEKLSLLFETEFYKFCHENLSVMSWALASRRTSAIANLNNVRMKDLFAIDAGKVTLKAKPGGYADLDAYLAAKLAPAGPSETERKKATRDLATGDSLVNLIRGKYALWFVFEFCNSVKKSAGDLCSSIAKARSGFPNLSLSNGLPNAAACARAPGCLRDFVRVNAIAHASGL
jgi:hypothetical protein